MNASGDADLEVVVARPEDADDVARLNAVVQGLHAEREPEVFKADVDICEAALFFRGAIAARDSQTILIAKLGGAPRGYALVEEISRQATPFKHARRSLMVHQIAVDPSARRRGVGRGLIEAAAAEASARKVDEIVLDHWAFNSDAGAFFAALGFAPRRVFLSRPTGSDR